MAASTVNHQQGLARTEAGGLAQKRFDELVSKPIRTPKELADTVREQQAQAFILSPAIAISSIAQGYVVNRAVVAIDPTFDAKTGRGADVYHQASIHKREKRGNEWVPLEVSLNKTALIRVMSAAGVDITRSERTDNGKDPYYWAWASEGTIIDFDGRKRRLPPGNVEIDYRDGSATIGEWTPEKWAAAETAAQAARQRRQLKDDEAWKEKPQAIGGWSGERVMSARRFGLRIAEAESLNRLIRNLGIKQIYTIDELEQKPFLIFRCSPDMNDADVKRMVMASHLGATDLLYGRGSAPVPALQSGDVIDIHAGAGEEHAQAATGSTASEPMPYRTSAAPSDATELDDIPEPPKPPEPVPVARTYTLTRATQLDVKDQPHYFFESKEGVTFVTEDRQAARLLNAARKDGRAISIESERVEINGGAYQHVLDCPPATGTAGQQSLPDPRNL